LLKDSKWNIKAMPKHSILEVIVEIQIDFNAKEKMTSNIINNAVSSALEIAYRL
jgi:hypothetical protein